MFLFNIILIVIIALSGLVSARVGIVTRIGNVVALLIGLFVLPFIPLLVRSGIIRSEALSNALSPLAGDFVTESVNRTGLEDALNNLPFINSLQEQGIAMASESLVLILLRILIFVVLFFLFRLVFVFLFKGLNLVNLLNRSRLFKTLNTTLGFVYGVLLIVVPIWALLTIGLLLSRFALVNTALDFLVQVPTIGWLFNINPFFAFI
jgi:hypothetical protein